MHAGFGGETWEKGPTENSGEHEKILLRWIFRQCDGSCMTGLDWLRTGTVGGSCECGNAL